jgi:hypothetical protein
MADPLRKAAPIGSVGGYPSRASQDMARRHAHPQDGSEASQQEVVKSDEVALHTGDSIARRLLRERVVVQTRRQLGIGEGELVPSFAEAVDAEPIELFLGRLLSAQNQLAGLRVNVIPPDAIRKHLDIALRLSIAEVMDMLSTEAMGTPDGVQVVAEVLAEYGRRLADLAGDS